MNNADEKKPAEEKRYAQLSRSSIKLMAEQGGHAGISDLVATMLAEDSNYRIRELLHNATQIMKHQRRKKLTTLDIHKVFKTSDIEPVFGHNTNSTEPVNMTWVREAEVFAPESEDIDLLEYISTPAVVDLAPSPHIEVEWVAVEGISKTPLPSTATLMDIKLSPKKLPVGPDLMEYYNQITKAVLGNQDDMLKFALLDLQTNDHITPLLPYLINFVSTGLNKLSHDLTQMTKLLRVINSLVTNRSLYLGCTPYLNLLVQSVLYCILEPLAACINPINDHWALRDMASHLLAHILKEWSTPHNNLRKNTVSALRNSFRDLSKPLCYHYGAVVGLLAIGVEEVELCIMPYLYMYWHRLKAALDDISCPQPQVKMDAHRVHGVLLLTCELILLNKMKKPFSDDLPRLYLQFYKLFGDVLSLHLPPINIPPSEIYTKPKPPEVSQLFNAPELLMTGEELLESFHEKEEDGKSSVAEEENSDESDIVSDNEEKVALRIKSTISDPTLGIKLTIAKLRKDRPPPPAASPPPPKRRIITLPLQPQDRQVFIPVTLRPHTHIEFCFEGSTPVPQHLLKMRQYRRDCPPPPLTHYRHLVKRLKPTAKLHKPPPRLIFRRKLMSGNLINCL